VPAPPTAVSKRILERIWAELPAQLGTVVSVGAELGPVAIEESWTPRAGTYHAVLDREEPSSGTLVLAFEVPLAIACAGQLVLLPDEAVREKIAKNDLAPDDLDAMGECVNMFSSAIVAAVRGEIGETERFVLRSGSLAPPELEEPLLVATGELRFGELACGCFEIVASRSMWTRGAGEPRRSAPPEVEPAAGDGVQLTAEELAAIRAATQVGFSGKTVLVVPLLAQRREWTELLADSGLEIEYVGDSHQLLQLCRSGVVDRVVIDADACPSGGLGILAALRGRADAAIPRVVVASRPTRRHLVSCMAAGATVYVAKPLEAAALSEHLGAR